MKAGKTQRFWRKNLGLKLLALGFALFLWFFVVGEEKAEVSLSVPLELVNMPNDMTIVNKFNGMIDVRVYGPRSLVRELSTQRTSHVVDLTYAKPGKMILDISPENIRLPRGVKVVRVQPTQVTLILEPVAQQEVPVEAALNGKIASDYEIKNVKLKPPTMVVSGAVSQVTKVKKILTQPIDISGLTASLEKVVGLDLDMSQFKVVGEAQVTACITVEEKNIYRDLIKPIEGVGSEYNYKVNPRIVRLSVRGPASALRNADQGQNVRAVVQLKGLNPGVHTRRPIILAPSGVKIEKSWPKTVKVTIFE